MQLLLPQRKRRSSEYTIYFITRSNIFPWILYIEINKHNACFKFQSNYLIAFNTTVLLNKKLPTWTFKKR